MGRKGNKAFSALREKKRERLSASRRAELRRAQREELRERGELDDNMVRRLRGRRSLRLYSRWDRKLSEAAWRALPMETKLFLLKLSEAEEEAE